MCSHTRLADCLQTAASVPTVDQTASAFPDADADDRCLLFRRKDEGGGRGREGESEQLIERLFPIGTHSVSLAHLRLRLIFVEVEEKNQDKMCT